MEACSSSKSNREPVALPDAWTTGDRFDDVGLLLAEEDKEDGS